MSTNDTLNDTPVASFDDLGLIEPLRRALAAEKHTSPTPIQAQSIPLLLQGGDLLGLAQTGTGKTAAFMLPLLQRLAAMPGRPQPKSALALVLAPTRELALQIAERARAYGRFLRLRQAVVFGGVGQMPQVKALAPGVDILIATPGRLLDLLAQNHLRLDRATTLVLDEADRMFDMGFIRDLRRIVNCLPRERQTLLFSATMPPEIAKLAAEVLRDPKRVDVSPKAVTVERIDQRLYFVDAAAKRKLLVEILSDPALGRTLVFTRTKHGADRVAEHLDRAGIAAAAIHGNKSQGARQRALADFRGGAVKVLVATDIAARGLDIPGVTHVVNFELPNEPESYVHRIGRTARAGADGIAIAFCSHEERGLLRDIERVTKRPLIVVENRLGEMMHARPAQQPQPQRRPPQRRDQPHSGDRRRRAA